MTSGSGSWGAASLGDFRHDPQLFFERLAPGDFIRVDEQATGIIDLD